VEAGGELRLAVGGLLVLAGAIAYFTFRPVVPPGVELIGDETRIAELKAKLKGRYRAAGGRCGCWALAG
jgi:hypothetical protein